MILNVSSNHNDLMISSWASSQGAAHTASQEAEPSQKPGLSVIAGEVQLCLTGSKEALWGSHAADRGDADVFPAVASQEVFTYGHRAGRLPGQQAGTGLGFYLV